MTYWAMAATVTLATYAVVSLATTPIAIGLWRLARHDPDAGSPAERAAGLLLVRALPVVVAATLAAGLVGPAFHLFEPRDTEEVAGRSLVALAAVGGALLALGLARGSWALARTSRLLRAWRRDAGSLAVEGSPVPALRIEWPFPLVAVVGLVRPRLVVARQVLEACTPAQLRAVVAHEAAHLAARDNLKRLGLRSLPDLLALTRIGPQMERDWAAAAEESADDRAAGSASSLALDLAEALLTVARLAPPVPTPAETPVPLSALIERGTIERRVRRLMGGRPAGRRRPAWLVAARAVGLSAVALAAIGTLAGLGVIETHLLAGVQTLVEFAVTSLR